MWSGCDINGQNRMSKHLIMPRFTLCGQISHEDLGICVQRLCEISNTPWKRDMSVRPEWDMILCKGTEEAMVRNTCRVALMDMKSTRELLQMSNLNETMDQLAKANGVRWYGHVLRKEKKNLLRRALDLKAKGARQRGRPKKTWLIAVIQQSRNATLNESDANNR